MHLTDQQIEKEERQTAAFRRDIGLSALPPPEPQGACERSRLATCSLPVALVDDIIEQLDFYADYCVAGGEHPAADHAKKTAGDLRARANAARANMRQPRENAPAEPTPTAPKLNP